MRRWMFLGILLPGLCLPLGCNQRNGLPNIPHRVISVEQTDETMNAAMSKSRETFSQFEKNWTGRRVDLHSIKFAIPSDADLLEHIWFTPIRIDGDRITARCANDPKDVADLKYGDVRTFNRSEISDWMIMENGKCYGGYTIRVLAELDPANAPDLEFADYPVDAK